MSPAPPRAPRAPRVPRVERAVLGNGLRVVTMPDPGSPVVGVAVVYDVGFRSEPEGRTGFAHLFEHMMFQGSANVGKAEHPRLVEAAGGIMNGSTLADLTFYYEALPPSALELALFLEADRMASLALTEENLHNQVDVVKEEIRVNVLNRPYGGFPWILLPALAFDLYPNAHNGYGDFSHLERASIEECKDFYTTYYSPSNAVLAVVGPVVPEKVVDLAERYFGGIRRRRVPKHGPWPEPSLPSERHRVVPDPLAPQPALAIGYRSADPVRELDRYLAFFLLAGVLSDGDASRLRSRLVHRDRLVTDVGCLLGTFGEDAFFVRGPTLFQVVVHHPGVVRADDLVRAVDEEIERLADSGPGPDELRRVVATSSADLWRSLAGVPERAVTIGALETVHGQAGLMYELADRLAKVSSADIAAAAAHLHGQHRAVLEVAPRPEGTVGDRS